jgi:hypothetical protein
VYQEDGSWQAHGKRRLQDASSPWVLEADLHAQQSADKGQTVQRLIHSAVMYGAEVWDTTKAVKDKMSAVVKKASAAF